MRTDARSVGTPPRRRASCGCCRSTHSAASCSPHQAETLASSVSWLKDHFQPELKQSRRSCLQRPAEVRRCNVVVGRCERSVIGGIETLRPKLNTNPLSHCNILEQRQINVRDPGRADYVTAFI